MSANSELARLISKDLGIESDRLLKKSSLEDLKLALIRILNHFLDTDMSRLVNALYRIDISESKVKQILAISESNQIGNELAELIINRELQKIETRKKYGSI